MSNPASNTATLTTTPLSTDEITTWGASRSQLEAILEGMAEGLLVFDPATTEVLYLNETAQNLLGLAAGEGKHNVAWYIEKFPMHYVDGSPVPDSERPLNRVVRGRVSAGSSCALPRRVRSPGQPASAARWSKTLSCWAS